MFSLFLGLGLDLFVTTVMKSLQHIRLYNCEDQASSADVLGSDTSSKRVRVSKISFIGTHRIPAEANECNLVEASLAGIVAAQAVCQY